MSKDPVLVIEEFLQRDQPQLRRNAVVALGTLRAMGCVDRLVDVTLTDVDATVSEAAERELVDAIKSGNKRIFDLYEQSRGQPRQRNMLYALMGRLRAKGAATPSAHGDLRQALALFTYAYPARGWKFFFRVFPAALAGAVVGFVLTALILGAVAGAAGMHQGVSSDLIVDALLGALLGVVGAELSAIRTTAYTLHYSRGIGALVEIAQALIFPAGFYTLIAVVIISMRAAAASSAFMPLVPLLAMIAVSRIVTILAAGTARSPLKRFFYAAAAAAAAGLITATISSWLLSTPQLWVWFLSGAAALAAAFASVDARVPSSARSRARALFAGSLIVLIVIMLLDLALSAYLGSSKYRDVRLDALPIGAKLESTPTTTRQQILVDKVPFHVSLNARQTVRLTLQWQAPYNVVLMDSSHKQLETGNPFIDRMLTAGTYELYFGLGNAELASNNALSKTLETLGALFRRTNGIAQSSLPRPVIISAYLWNPSPTPSASVPAQTPFSGFLGDNATPPRTALAQSRVESGTKNARLGQISAALAQFREARRIDPNVVISPNDWNALCWFATAYKHAAEVVDDACENAVALSPDDYHIRDSRGVARAMTGRTQGAIEDLNFFIAATDKADRRAQRQRWVESMRAGRNPFTQEDLRSLPEQW